MISTEVTNECGAFKAGIADFITALEGFVEVTLVSVNMNLDEAQSMMGVIVIYG